MRKLSLVWVVSLATASSSAAGAVAAPRKVHVERRDVRRIVEVAASLAPRMAASLAAPAAGIVGDVVVDLGTVVKKGQRLASITSVHGGKPVALVAPFDGVITGRNALPGVYTGEGVPLFTLIDFAVLHVELDVPELDVPQLRVGQEITARFEAMPGRLYKSKLALMVPWIDSRTRTLHADGELDNPTRALLPGMSGVASIETESHAHALVVPAAAVFADGQNRAVLRLEGGHARKAAVRTGIVDGEWIEVTNGLGDDDTILIGAKEGDAVP